MLVCIVIFVVIVPPQDKKRRGMPKVWLYKNKETGEFNGDATVTYEDAFAAMSAPKWFDGKEFKGGLSVWGGGVGVWYFYSVFYSSVL